MYASHPSSTPAVSFLPSHSLNFNIGPAVDLSVPKSFWSRLAGRYGTTFFWREKGETAAILNAVSAIDFCLREEPGRSACADVHGLEDDELKATGSKLFGFL